MTVYYYWVYWKIFAVKSGNHNWVLTLNPWGQILRMNAPRKALIAWNFGDKMIALATARNSLEPRSNSLGCCPQNSRVVNELLRVICVYTFLVWVLPRNHHCTLYCAWFHWQVKGFTTLRNATSPAIRGFLPSKNNPQRYRHPSRYTADTLLVPMWIYFCPLNLCVLPVVLHGTEG